ncbi:acid phosphatase [Saccharopolyspora rosea]|uniref:Acid phosphatase n=1 Tax=Saccharopolyspora rosea TaxID=524884 RepID=A0ABW3FYW4_9PSEU|nr:acid phosphatase [Saccharopolyspora rosea]
MTPDEHRVYVLRHATTEWSSSGRHTSRTDIPLTAEGELRARQAGQTLTALRPAGPVLVLASPRRRARRTAELAGLPDVAVEPLLAEWDYGEYEGMTTEQIRDSVPDWTVWTHPCPGGESASEVAARADKLLDRVREAASDVVLVGHGHFSRALIARWLGLPVTAGVHFALDPAGIAVLGHERGAPQVVRSNMPPWQQG